MTFPRLHPTQQEKSAARYYQPCEGTLFFFATKVVVSQPYLLFVRVSPTSISSNSKRLLVAISCVVFNIQTNQFSKKFILSFHTIKNVAKNHHLRTVNQLNGNVNYV